nr:uncharacterized protein LOC129453647 isoform X2 [Misgurnus anguillicaudatus]
MIFRQSEMEKLIHLILLFVLISIPGSFEVNLARKGTATQSSTATAAQNAIDGVRYGATASSCSITGNEWSPWWRLDLLDYYEISTVVITTRSDCCLWETNGAEIRIGNSTENDGNDNPICAVTSGGQTISYSCGVMVGRYINVVMTGRTSTLSLCEVEVYDTENVAFSGIATLSSTYYIFVAQNAIDGVKYGPGEGAFCASTEYQYYPWWRLDLQYKYEISTVVITARSDGSAYQTNGAEIRIGNSLDNNGNNNPRCDVTSGFQAGQTISYSCNGMEGRYVNLVMTGYWSYLSFCEVEIYGKRHIKKKLLRLKFLSSVDAAAVSDQILNQLESALSSLHISDFTLSWTRRPYKEKVTQHQKITGSCAKIPT